VNELLLEGKKTRGKKPRKTTGAPRPRARNTCPKEWAEAELFVLRLEGLRAAGHAIKFSCVAHGRKLPPKLVKQLEREGLRAGVPDYLIVVNNRILFVELKRQKGGSASPEQKDWLWALQAAGAYTTVAKGALEAQRFVEQYLTLL
jgi:hypothetical protein